MQLKQCLFVYYEPNWIACVYVVRLQEKAALESLSQQLKQSEESKFTHAMMDFGDSDGKILIILCINAFVWSRCAV